MGALVDSGDIDLIALDFDGVLTDNRVIVFEDGREAVVCNRADGLAFDFLLRVGMPVYILSRETNPVVKARAAKLGVPMLAAVGDKAKELERLCAENGHVIERTMYVGNDVNNVAAMKIAGYPVAVADAHPAAREAAWCVLETRGGDGVVREIVEHTVRFDQRLFEPARP